MITAAPSPTYAASYIAETTYNNRDTHRSYDDYWRGKNGCYAFSGFDERVGTEDTDLINRMVTVMQNLYYDRYSYDPGTLANMPKLTYCSNPTDAVITIRHWPLAVGATGYTHGPGLISIGNEGTSGTVNGEPYTLRWCWSQRTTGCMDVGTTLTHELGHAFGLEHSYAGLNPGAQYTVMNATQSKWDKFVKFGACDVASFQALYGTPSPSTPLSGCLFGGSTSVSITVPSKATVGISIPVYATMSIDWTVLWYAGTTAQTAAAINRQGLTGVPLKANVHLWQSYQGVSTDLGPMTLTSGTTYQGWIPRIPGKADYWAVVVRSPLANLVGASKTING
jgi:hypothetical protein